MPSSKTFIGDTAYDIKNGRVFIGSTGYDIKKGRTLIGSTGYDIKFTVPLAELAEGTVITIKENGSPVEFFTAKQNYESDLNGLGRVLFIRKNCLDELQQASSSSNRMSFEYTSLCGNLNKTYLARFSSAVQAAISTTTFFSERASGTATKAIFVLSATEMGYVKSYTTSGAAVTTIVEGTKLSISELLIPSEREQWTRTTSSQDPWRVAVSTSGEFSAVKQTFELGVCPCFTLPATMEVDSNLELIEE